MDGKGRVLVMVTEGAMTLWEYAEFLAGAGLGLREVMLMDGGGESQLDLKIGRLQYEQYGGPSTTPDLLWPRQVLPAAWPYFPASLPNKTPKLRIAAYRQKNDDRPVCLVRGEGAPDRMRFPRSHPARRRVDATSIGGTLILADMPLSRLDAAGRWAHPGRPSRASGCLVQSWRSVEAGDWPWSAHSAAH